MVSPKNSTLRNVRCFKEKYLGKTRITHTTLDTLAFDPEPEEHPPPMAGEGYGGLCR